VDKRFGHNLNLDFRLFGGKSHRLQTTGICQCIKW
jgi:hypothetical protein